MVNSLTFLNLRMHPSRSGLLMALALLAAASAGPAAAQQADSARADTAVAPIIQLNTLPPGHTPDGALWRAAALPGWGQIYNGQYWKLPIVYAGLGALIYSTIYNWKRYKLYQCAWAYVRQPDNYPECQDERNQFKKIINAGQAKLLMRRRKAYRRNFELSIIGGILFYGLTVLDAYVSAHLLSFEVANNVALRVSPRTDGAAATLRLRF